MNQATTAAIWYQGMLSIYFLLTTRYGMKNATIAKRIEPLMHIVALGYPIGTAIVGAGMGIYGERAGAASCYVRSYDKSSASDQDEKSTTDAVMYMFFAIPVLTVFICLVFNNISIYLFVRHYTRKCSSKEGKDPAPANTNVSFGWSERSALPMQSSQGSSRNASTTNQPTTRQHRRNNDKRSTRKLASQSQRLQLVCSQAFLFVLAFVLCHTWNVAMEILQGSVQNRADETEMMMKYYPLAVVQATLLPLQGLFNMIIFLRPKYLMLRLEFPIEGRLWTAQRIFLGNQLRPAGASGRRVGRAPVDNVVNRRCEAESDTDAATGDMEGSGLAPSRLPRNMISSLTASGGDFDGSAADGLQGEELQKNARTQGLGSQGAPTGLASGHNRLPSLGAISELSESVFDLTPYQANGSHLFTSSVTLPILTEPSESRWKGAGTTAASCLQSRGSDLGDTEKSHRTDSSLKIPRRKPEISDLPIQAPRRPSDICNVSDSPIRIPKRTFDAPIDSPTGSCSSSTSDLSPVINSKRVTMPHIGSARGKLPFDMPLAPPERFLSLPPSDIED
ncbi:unnamed protein product [Cylindrotheca closterium]|uniref:Uncharacterized protein n=1 Tax=Cylindrotheca closterium TaxID=2856 RepID=A0AAD2CTL3_9STRA|nr:unnamed protein product [Cylindrotheca closterium]